MKEQEIAELVGLTKDCRIQFEGIDRIYWVLTEEEYNRLKEIEAMYESLCK